MASFVTPRRIPLDPEQADRFRAFFHNRTYRYTPGDREKGPKFRLIPFLEECKKQLPIKKIDLQGGARLHLLKGGKAVFYDVDIEFELKGTADWRKVEEVFLNALEKEVGPLAKELDARRIRKLLPNEFALHGISTRFQGKDQPLDFKFMAEGKSTPIHSAYAFRIDLASLFDPSIRDIYVEATGDYDVQECLNALENNQFFVKDPSLISKIRGGLERYCHTLTRGAYPMDPEIETAFFHSVPSEKGVTAFLNEHYPKDTRGGMIYCLNYLSILTRQEGTEITPLKEKLFRHLYSALKLSKSSPEDLPLFARFAVCYFYLKSKDSVPVGPNTFIPVRCGDPSNPIDHYLYAPSPEKDLNAVGEHFDWIVNNPWMIQLAKSFPTPGKRLHDLFKPYLPKKQLAPSPEEKLPLSLKEMIGQRPIREVIEEYQKAPDASLLPDIAKVSFKAFFELLPLTPEFSPSALLEEYFEQALPFMPVSIARTLVSEQRLKSLVEKYEDTLFGERTIEAEALQLYIAKWPNLQQVKELFERLEPRLLQEENPLQWLDLFLERLYPSTINQISPDWQTYLQNHAETAEAQAILQRLKPKKQKKKNPPSLKPAAQPSLGQWNTPLDAIQGLSDQKGTSSLQRLQTAFKNKKFSPIDLLTHADFPFDLLLKQKIGDSLMNLCIESCSDKNERIEVREKLALHLLKQGEILKALHQMELLCDDLKSAQRAFHKKSDKAVEIARQVIGAACQAEEAKLSIEQLQPIQEKIFSLLVKIQNYWAILPASMDRPTAEREVRGNPMRKIEFLLSGLRKENISSIGKTPADLYRFLTRLPPATPEEKTPGPRIIDVAFHSLSAAFKYIELSIKKSPDGSIEPEFQLLESVFERKQMTPIDFVKGDFFAPIFKTLYSHSGGRKNINRLLNLCKKYANPFEVLLMHPSFIIHFYNQKAFLAGFSEAEKALKELTLTPLFGDNSKAETIPILVRITLFALIAPENYSSLPSSVLAEVKKRVFSFLLQAYDSWPITHDLVEPEEKIAILLAYVAGRKIESFGTTPDELFDFLCRPEFFSALSALTTQKSNSKFTVNPSIVNA